MLLFLQIYPSINFKEKVLYLFCNDVIIIQVSKRVIELRQLRWKARKAGKKTQKQGKTFEKVLPPSYAQSRCALVVRFLCKSVQSLGGDPQHIEHSRLLSATTIRRRSTREDATQLQQRVGVKWIETAIRQKPL